LQALHSCEQANFKFKPEFRVAREQIYIAYLGLFNANSLRSTIVMFKRVERKLKKKQKEEELGIDEDMKEVLGIHDTDSDESDSESESSSSSSSDENSDGDKDRVQRTNHSLEKKRKRGAFESEDDEKVVDESDEDAGSTDPEDGNEDEEDEDWGDEDEDDDDAVDMSVEEALHNPLYIVSIQPDIRACILCPGKLLKTPKVVEVHEASQAHRRRSKRFKELADGTDPEDNARDILKNGLSAFSSQTKSSEQSSQKLSKRAIKRVAKFEQMKKRRQKQKAGKAKTLAKKAEKSAAAPLAAPTTLDDLESEKPLRTKKQNTNPPSSNRDRPKIKTPSTALNGTHPKKSKIPAQLPATKVRSAKERPNKRRKPSETLT